MSLLSALLVNFGRLASLLQVLLYLPLTLDLAGTDAFLALSAALASYYFTLSTIRLMTRRTRLAWIGTFLATFQFLVIPACLLICFNVYSPPSESYFAHVAKRPSVSSAFQAARSASTAATSPTSGGGLFGFRARSKWSNAAASSGGQAKKPQDDITPAVAAAGLLLDEVDESLAVLLKYGIAAFLFLVKNVPGWWSTFLRISSPIFSLLEGIASVLVIQAIGSISRWVIAASLARPPTPKKRLLSYLPSFGLGGAEGWQLLFLLLSAFTYVSSAAALYISFESATRDRPGAAAAVGASVSSTLWLTAIAFAVRKGNVVETSLMLAYVVFNVTQLSDSLAFTADPLALIRSFKVNAESGSPIPLLPTVISSAQTFLHVGGRIAGQSIDFVSAAFAALPKSVIVSLVYRLMVLYAASRILPLLKDGGPPMWLKNAQDVRYRPAASANEREKSPASPMDQYGSNDDDYSDEYDDSEDEYESSDPGRRSTAEGKRLSEEEPFGAFIQIIVSYSRLIMIAVYSHLLLLDQSHQIYWRFLTVGITLALWAFELLIGKEDGDAFTREWKLQSNL